MLSRLASRPFPWQFKAREPGAGPRFLRTGLVLGDVSPKDGTLALMSRARCRVRHFALADVPAAERRKVLRHLVQAWSPFDRSDYAIVLQGAQAMAYAWDGAQVEDDLRTAALDLSVFRIVPEGLMQAPMSEDGVRLLHTLDGDELQAWRGGVLQISRWWDHAPDALEVNTFLRSQARADVSLPTAVQTPQWLARPWAEAHDLPSLSSTRTRLEQWATGVALVGLAALTGAQLSAYFGVAQEHAAAEQALSAAKATVLPVIAARDHALSLAREADQLAAQMTAPQALEVMQHLAVLLPPKGVVLKDFELNGNKLRILLELAADIQRSALVKALQDGGWFTGVGEMRDVAGRGGVGFEMTLTNPWPPANVKLPSPSPESPVGGLKR